MRKFLAAVSLAFVAVFLSAQFPKVEHPFLANKNFLLNPGFEFGLSSWTKTGSATFTLDTSTPLDGAASADWNPTANGEFLRHASLVVPKAFRGRACLLGFTYSWDSGTAGHITAKVDDGTNDIYAATNLNVTSGGVPGKYEAGFVCPNSATPIRLTLTATADAASIKLDNAWLGSDHRRGVLGDQASHYAKLATTCGGVGWNTSSTTFASLGTATTCTTTDAIPPKFVVSGPSGTASPVYTLTNLPIGRYRAIFSAFTDLVASTTNDFGMTDTSCSDINVGDDNNRVRFSTTASVENLMAEVIFDFETNVVATKTITICARNAVGGTMRLTPSASPAYFTLIRYPNQDQRDTLTQETSGFNASGYITTPTNVSLGITTDADFTNIAGGSDLTLTNDNASFSAKIPCSAPNPPTGTTCSAGTEQVGFSIDVPRIGWYWVKISFMHNSVSDSGEFEFNKFKIGETSTTSHTIISESRTIETGHQAVSGATTNAQTIIQVTLEKFFYFSAAGTKTFRVFERTAGSPGNTNVISADNADGRAITWQIVPVAEGLSQTFALNNIETGAGHGGCTKGNLCSGSTWTIALNDPSGTGTFASPSAQGYSRVGNQICATAGFTLNTCTANTKCVTDLVPPIPFNSSDAGDLFGAGTCIESGAPAGAGYVCTVTGDTTGDEAEVTCLGGQNNLNACRVTFCYEVVP